MKKVHGLNQVLFLVLLFLFALFAGLFLMKTVLQATDAEANAVSIRHISGQIAHYSLGKGNSIRLTYWGESNKGYPDFGTGKIAVDGSFTINSLKAVPNELLFDISEMPSCIVVSDPSARIFGGCMLRLYVPKSANPGKTVYRGRLDRDSPVGGYCINFTYCDRPTTVRGSDPQTSSVWNLRLHKGWNRIAQVVTHLNPTIIEFTDIEPEDGSWFLY